MSEQRIQFQLNEDDPSLTKNNQALLRVRREYRPVEFTIEFDRLVNLLEDPYLAEMVWFTYGSDSIKMIDEPLRALNFDRKWWEFFKPRNTIRSLSKTRDGKIWLWQMLQDASAWL